MREKRIYALVVDDNEINTMILSNMLELFNIEVDSADSGMKALELVNDKEYDIIFIDHVMPILDGVQTTRIIRERIIQDKQVIIALTSSITEEILRQYQSAGAEGVYPKPLGLIELTAILKQWCPQLSEQEIPVQEKSIHYQGEASLLQTLIHDISEIDYEVGLRYALGDPNNYINILKVSLKDIKTFINMVLLGYDNKQWKDMRIGVHNMKSVFANIGAIEMVEIAKELEQVILHEDWIKVYNNIYGKRLTSFYEKLKSAIETYDRINSELMKEEQPNLLMTSEENEQSLDKVIYYIKRFDYAAILLELELLIKRGRPEYRKALEQALVNIKDFKYESALLVLTDIKMTDIKKEMEQGAISADTDYI
jgi:CheY-like chemotaxis protein/HPt (histidine-containing phosphotransfer) domain-containing protein